MSRNTEAKANDMHFAEHWKSTKSKWSEKFETFRSNFKVGQTVQMRLRLSAKVVLQQKTRPKRGVQCLLARQKRRKDEMYEAQIRTMIHVGTLKF
jgi:hypothetical protein